MSEDLENDKGFHTVGSGDAGWMGSLAGPFETYEEADKAGEDMNLAGDDGVHPGTEVNYSDGEGGLWILENEEWKQMWDESRPMPEILRKTNDPS